MKRSVYIGGFGSGQSAANRAAEALGKYYNNEHEPFTFSWAMKNPDQVRKAVHQANVVTHSAGMLAMLGTSPSRIESFSPPLPTGRLALVGKTVIKTARMFTPGIGIKEPSDIAAVGNYSASSVAELAVHPRANLGHLGEISRFDAVRAAIGATEQDIPVSLVYTSGDEYFSLSEERELDAKRAGVDVTRIQGIHDQFPIWPTDTLYNVARIQSM